MSGQVVQITINVTDGNATEAVQQVVAQLNAIGPAGEKAGAEAGAGLDQVGKHALSARENIRLLNDDLGLRVPRAMQAVIGQSQMLSSAIGMIGPGLIAMGGVDILMHVGESVYGAYEKFVELKDVIAESDAVMKSFGDDAAAAMRRASEEYERYLRITKGPQAADQYNLDQYKVTAIHIPTYQTDEFKKLPDEVKGNMEAITGESVMPKDLDQTIAKMRTYVELQEKTLATMREINSDPNAGVVPTRSGAPPEGYSQAQITMQERLVREGHDALTDLWADQHEYAQRVMTSQAQVSADAKQKNDEAAAKEKEKQAEITQLQTSARNSELSGIALLEAQREQALSTFTSKYAQSRAAINAISIEYNNKEIALWNQQWEEAEKVMRTAQQAADQAAHIGFGSIENTHQNTLSDIDKKEADGFDPGAAAKLRKAADTTANNEILAAQRQFEEEMQQIGTRADDAQQVGYARIAEADHNSIAKVEADWQVLADKVGKDSDAAADAWGKALMTMEDIHDNTSREMEQLHTKTMEQITKEEEQTARLSAPEWQQAQMKIVDAFQDRSREVEEIERQQDATLDALVKQNYMSAVTAEHAKAMLHQDTNAQIVAAYQLMNAQMQQADEETRNKLASGLQSMFSNPMQFFEKRAMDTAFELMANEMLSTFKSSGAAGGMLQYLFGMGPEMSTDTNPLTAMKSALGMGGHAGMGSTNPSMITFQQGSTTLMSGSQALLTAATTLQSAASTLSMSGGMSGFGSGAGSFGMFGSTAAGSSSDSSAGLAGMLETSGDPLEGSLLADGSFSSLSAMPELTHDPLSGTLNSDGSFTSSAASGTPGPLGAAMGMAGGALMAGASMEAAYKDSNPVAGMLGGAMGGMEAGAALGSIVPGLGTVVGGAIGAVVGGIGGLLAGLFGDKGRGQAEGLDTNTIQPALTKDMEDYDAGRSGYNTISGDLANMLISAQNSTSQWGSGARNYFNSNILPEIQAVQASLQKQEIGGRGSLTLSAAQYHTGGFIDDFGDFGTNSNEGFIHAMRDEFVVKPAAAAAHAPILQAMNAGANFGYSNAVQPRMPASSGSGATVNLTVQALDSKSVASWAQGGGGRALVAAINQAQRQYSGVGRG